ncbi:MAG: PKD domain-containing protein [Vicinamibacteraceae bacterium]
MRRGRMRRASLLGWLPVAAAIALSGCTVKKTEAPDITGPSELGLSLELRVSPDVLNMDGVSQSTLTITSRDSNGKIEPNVDVRVEAMAGGEIVDVIGRLSTKNVKTGGDGRATLTYTAPNSGSSQNSDSGNMIMTLAAIPAGYDYHNAVVRQVQIRLVPQGILLPQPFAPVARFTLSPTAPGEDQDVIFDATGSTASCVPDPTDPNNASKCTPQSGAITSYQWDFGNGQTASGPRVTTRFSTRGIYTVRLVVTNDRGLSNSTTQAVTVNGVPNPTAGFELSPANPGVNQQVFFDANASAAAPGRTISRYDWNFGDGFSGNGVTESHRFARAGSFTVTLTVTDSAGRTSTASKTVTVGNTVGPTAAFTVSPGTVAANAVAFFDGTVSTSTPGRTIVRYEWNFGDNQIVEGPRAEHAFRIAGSYSVTLTVTDSNGASDTETKSVTVTP